MIKDATTIPESAIKEHVELAKKNKKKRACKEEEERDRAPLRALHLARTHAVISESDSHAHAYLVFFFFPLYLYNVVVVVLCRREDKIKYNIGVTARGKGLKVSSIYFQTDLEFLSKA